MTRSLRILLISLFLIVMMLLGQAKYSMALVNGHYSPGQVERCKKMLDHEGYNVTQRVITAKETTETLGGLSHLNQRLLKDFYNAGVSSNIQVNEFPNDNTKKTQQVAWSTYNECKAGKHGCDKKDVVKVAVKKTNTGTYLGKGHVTSYYSPTTGRVAAGTNINCMGYCNQTANGLKMNQSHAYNVVACDPKWKFGTKFRLVGGGLNTVVTCQDRGGAIKGNLRMDIWTGIGASSRSYKTYYPDIYLID